MPLKAIIFGSLSTLAETSRLQWDAFNAAFTEHNLDWHWPEHEYKQMLKKSGGKDRIDGYASERGQNVDAAAIHKTKTRIFDDLLAKKGVELRPGVVDVIEYARSHNIKLGFATNTVQENIDALFDGLKGVLKKEQFHFIGNKDMVANAKPAPDIFLEALKQLGVYAEDTVAIEDTGICAKSAIDAGITTIAYPNIFADAADFDGVALITDGLTVDQVKSALQEDKTA